MAQNSLFLNMKEKLQKRVFIDSYAYYCELLDIILPQLLKNIKPNLDQIKQS
jgi:hypothetical protein